MKLLTGNYFAVPIPDWIKIIDLWTGSGLRGRKKDIDYLMGANFKEKFEYELPPGNWKLIGISDEISEDQAAEIVVRVAGWDKVLYYDYNASGRDFRDIVEAAFDKAHPSFQSLLKSKNLTRCAIIQNLNV